MGIAAKRKGALWYLIPILIIIAVPLGTSFLGIDMSDTGFYMYHYTHPVSDYITYSSYFATVVGAVWYRFFPFLGVWGLCLLEVILEWLTSCLVYWAFSSVFGRVNTLCGLAFCQCAVSTYVNIFNYHQLNMFLCVALVCFTYKAYIRNSCFSMLMAGICGGLAIAARFPSVLTVFNVICIFYWTILLQNNRKLFIKHTISFGAGYVIILGIYVVFMKMIGRFDKVISDVFRIGSLASTSGSYGTSGMLSYLISDSLETILTAAVIYVLLALLLVIAQRVNQYFSEMKLQRTAILAAVSILVFVVLNFLAANTIQIPAFAQLTTFPWLVYGLALLPQAAVVIYGLLSKKQSSKEMGLVALLSLELMLLVLCGSNTRLKHAILGIWIFAPAVFSFIDARLSSRRKIALKFSNGTAFYADARTGRVPAIVLAAFLVTRLAVFVGSTNNFDDTNLFKLNTKINSSSVSLMRTTERRAEAVNGVLEAIDELDLDPDEDSLIIIGNGLLFYTLTDLDAFVKPWTTGTSYTAEKMEEDIEKRLNEGASMPVFIVCSTNNYYGFSEDEYLDLYYDEYSKDYDGKKDYFESFAYNNGYSEIYSNDYYAVFSK